MINSRFFDVEINESELKKKSFNLSNDLAFKLVFQNQEFLSLFLSVFWNKNIKKEDITITNSEVLNNNIFEHKIILDVNSEVLDDNTVVVLNLEMQNSNPGLYDVFDRSFYYFAKNKASSLKRGDNYNKRPSASFEKMTRTECIMFTNFDVFKDGKWHYEAGFMYNNNFLTEDRFHYISLPNYKECSIIEIEELLKCFNTNLKSLNEQKTLLGKEAVRMLEEINKDEKLKRDMYKVELYEYYDNLEKNRLNKELKEAKDLACASNKRADDEAKRADDEAKRANSLKENQIQMVKNLYGYGVAIDVIAKSANLSIEEIKEIIG